MALDPDRLASLRHRYGESHRAYHVFAHVEALLADLDLIAEIIHHRDAVELAIYYHDAVYDPLARTNESDSAELLQRELGPSLERETLEAAKAMINATAGHELPPIGTDGFRSDCAHFLDLDLAILGAPAEAFDRYDETIRWEYAFLAPEAYRAGRLKVLETFLARGRLFKTDRIAARCEAEARANLARARERLFLANLPSARAYREGAGEESPFKGLARHRRRLVWLPLARLLAGPPLGREALHALAHPLALSGYGIEALQRILAEEIAPVMARADALAGEGLTIDRLEHAVTLQLESDARARSGLLGLAQAFATRTRERALMKRLEGAWGHLVEAVRLFHQTYRMDAG